MGIIYFDNAATSWPKPPAVMDAMIEFNSSIGSNPGRSGHSGSIDAGRVLFNTRYLLSELFKIPDPLSISFTSNATHSLNIAIRGLLKQGDHVITTSMEHNSVMRPLCALAEEGIISITRVRCDDFGRVDSHDIKKSIRSNTRMIIVTHASNVTGTIIPVEEIGIIASNAGVTFCVDASQSAGVLDIDVAAMNIDILCFTGHKGLLGPMGTGGIYVRKGLESDIAPLMSGGTGSKSEFETHPEFMPDRFESGTPNAVGIAGLGAGVDFILQEGIALMRKQELELTGYFLESLREIDDVKLYGMPEVEGRTSVVAFNIKGVSPSDSAFYFDDIYGIRSRPGLHCAPSAHRTIGSFPEGTNRFSFSFFNTASEIDVSLDAVRYIIKKRG